MTYYHGTFSKINFDTFAPDETGAMYFTNCPNDAYMYATKFQTLQEVGTIVNHSRIFKLNIEVENSLYLDDHYSLMDIIFKKDLEILEEVKNVIYGRIQGEEEYLEFQDIMDLINLYPFVEDKQKKIKIFILLKPFLTHSKTFNKEILLNGYDSIINRYDELQKDKHHIIIFDNFHIK